MNNTVLAVLACAAALVAGAGIAQPASAPAPGASAPQVGPMGMGRGAMRWGTGVTPGWSMMTPEERQAHQAKMQSMTDYASCKAYMDEHHQLMVQRAKERGTTMPAQPRRDACLGLKR